MLPGINPKQLEKVMKQMGVKQQEIEATEVVITLKDRDLIIRHPHVTKVNMMGQESLQVTGDIEERPREAYSPEDVRTVMDQAHCSEAEARKSLDQAHGDLAEAILRLEGQ